MASNKMLIRCAVLSWNFFLLVHSKGNEINTTAAILNPESNIIPTANPKGPFSFTTNTGPNNNIYHKITQVGSNVDLDCSVTSFPNPISITWFKDDVNVQEKNFRFYYDNLNTTFKLHFKNVILADVGTYKCFISDRKGFNISKIFSLNIEGNGELELLPPKHKDISVVVGEKFTLNCFAKGDEDLAKYYQWDHRKTVLESDKLNNQQRFWTTVKKGQCSSSTLTIDNPKVADSGTYACTVFNKRRFVRATTNVVVSAGKGITDVKDKEREQAIIISVTCACAVLLILLLSVFLWRKFKSKHWSTRTHTYLYKSSLSQEPT